MSDYGEVTVTCGKCKKSASFDRWTETAIAGSLPHGHYQCPHCKFAFCRTTHPEAKPWEPFITLEPVQPCL